jgi:nucleotide-binding universal stress UspA family protein
MKILLAIDESQSSLEATRMLQRQFRTEDAEIRVLSVVEPISVYISADAFPHFTPHVESIEEDRRKQAADLVSQVARELRSAGFQAAEHVDLGDAKTKIIENATDWQADLIVMGSHGWKGLNRFLLGSVSDAVARHAPCSVEIVRLKPAPESN